MRACAHVCVCVFVWLGIEKDVEIIVCIWLFSINFGKEGH